MKIRSITLDGFWGYREGVRVDIAGLPMLVAVGHNGSGKSALVVNGIIAGLYGKFPTRTVEESITAGASSGSVIVEFDLSGSTYRVARTHQRSGAASASVHRRVGDDWEAVTEKGVREATAKVTELLGMDYDTAVMTWIAEQGKYDQFAAAQPAARFKMLASVFDLAKYVPLHRAAQETLRKAKEAAAIATGRVAELNDDLVDDDARAMDDISDDALAEATAAAHTAFDDASTSLATHLQHDPQIAIGHARNALAAVRDVRLERLRIAEQSLVELRTARDDAPHVREAAEIAAVQRFHRESARISETTAQAVAGTRQLIATAEDALAHAAAVTDQLPALHSVVSDAEVALAEAEKQNHHDETVARMEASARLHEASATQAAALTARNDAQEALGALAHAGDCYACGQHISEEVVATLRTAQEQLLASREADITEATTAVTRAQDAMHEVDVARQSSAAAVTARRTELAAARAEVDAAERTAVDAAHSRASLAASQTRLTELESLEQSEIARLAAERDEAISAADAAQEAALADITARGKQAAAAVNEQRRASAEEEQLDRDLTAAENIALGDARYPAETERLTAARDAARAEATRLDSEVGRRAEIARRQAEQSVRIAEAKTALATAENDVTVHTDLVAAYAPSGIPSMILETVIGDLNNAINVTLAELSGGELEVRLTTAREGSSGTAESKVTVYVDTPTGSRAYEALSGGQRFRVDLAIRTGLAAIIARGTGTPIETFILDEGWGSLDESGIRSTLGVLDKLSEQTNVLTVSHVDTVRESFPARIEVSTNEGTSAAVVVR